MSESPGQPAGARILVVDDESAIRRAITTNLTRHGYHVDGTDSGADAIRRHDLRPPDLMLLDLGLPDVDGLDVIHAIRGRARTPIIVLSVRGAERDKVAALDLGADDYLTKPFGVDELLARIRVALRHVAGPPRGSTAVFRTGELEVDIAQRVVHVDGRLVHLTPTEYGLLKSFIAHPNRVLTDRMLLEQVWGPAYGEEAHYLHVYVARLRKKLEADPQRPRYLRTEPGVGYRLIVDEEHHG
jgi:two-component system, OmpR family, KDP operon response regulator KdpE